jgi:hypothetical protein
MSTLQTITLRQGNTETVTVTITPDVPGDDLTLVTSLKLIMKPDPCTLDTATTVLTLSTAVPAQMVITSQTAAQIVAEAYIPASALVDSYDRWWRVDAYIGATYRTALYGPVIVIDL